MEWPGAELEAEAAIRVRGTWEHPILLGDIHVLSGGLLFHGNRYRVERGDINFANPFRIDPVINVEATTTIQQYEITLNFNGSASKLALAYRSDPPLPGNDIVALLALGQTSSESMVRSGGGTTGQWEAVPPEHPRCCLKHSPVRSADEWKNCSVSRIFASIPGLRASARRELKPTPRPELRCNSGSRRT